MLSIKNVIGMIGQTVRAGIFWYFKISKNSIDDVIFLRNVRNCHFGKNKKEKKNNISCASNNNEIEIGKRQRVTEQQKNTPSFNYCAATIVARPLRTTVKGERRPSGLRENQD